MELVGRTVRKAFAEGVFRGTLVSFDAESRLWHVKYEDGDEEDLDARDLLALGLDVGGRGGARPSSKHVCLRCGKSCASRSRKARRSCRTQ